MKGARGKAGMLTPNHDSRQDPPSRPHALCAKAASLMSVIKCAAGAGRGRRVPGDDSMSARVTVRRY